MMLDRALASEGNLFLPFGVHFLRTGMVETSPRAAGNALHVTIDRPTGASRPKLSPDGSRLLYQAEGRLWVRDLGKLESRPIPGTEEGGSGSDIVGYTALMDTNEELAFAILQKKPIHS